LKIERLLFFAFLLSFSTFQQANAQSKKEIRLKAKVAKKLQNWESPHRQWNHLGNVKIDSLAFQNDSLNIYFGKALSYLPIREGSVDITRKSISSALGKRLSKYPIGLITDNQSMESLIPNAYRKSLAIDYLRFGSSDQLRIPLVRRIDDGIYTKGLYNRNIALWHSHGWYYEAKLDRWEWQRARLYGTVEDIFPMTFVLPYLAPMLENAGANVFLPRERDTQINEVIIDNDVSSPGSTMNVEGISIDTIKHHGFFKKDTLFIGENPFLLGSHLRFKASQKGDNFIQYVPDIPEAGWYSVYISFAHAPENVSDAHYTVTHTGGTSNFLINQKIGGSTFVFLGKFHFDQGINPEKGTVKVFAQSKEEGWITLDAVKIGGGMGNVARRPSDEILPNQWSLSGGQKGPSATTKASNPENFQWKTSLKPRYQEGARYYLQYIGAPDSLVYSLHEEKNDYNDDYQSRGEWVNYLMGPPNGPNKDRLAAGLNIPVDLSLAFHTDAGITAKDSTIGTLAIYSSVRDKGRFISGQSKVVSRDLSDMIQTEIVNDIRSQFNPEWSRRGIWNREYSEAWRPSAPAMLLELLSHQNLSDVAYGHDPLFKFAVSRAIYKGMVKFLAFQSDHDYVIQPLPVDHFSLKRIGKKSIELSWRPVIDSLEFTAVPTSYKVYQRVNKDGFDNGRLVEGTSTVLEVDSFGTIYSYKITAINAGGESFPSEILSVGLLENEKDPVLVINGFDRVSAPAIVDDGDFAGIAHWEDEGVPDKNNIGYIGEQYDFDRKSKWLDDDSPGWGASYGDMEGKIIPGNSFDNTIHHGAAILASGHSYISTSDEAFSKQDFSLDAYSIIDLILGEEKTTKSLSGNLFQVFDDPIQEKIRSFTGNGGNVFASGAYIGSDHILNSDTIAQKFANEVLHFRWMTNHAVHNGEFYGTDYSKGSFEGQGKFCTSYDPYTYKVEAPDALEPHGEGAITAFRYSENNTSAGVAFSGSYKTIVLGFPFETITNVNVRNKMMNQILTFFD